MTGEHGGAVFLLLYLALMFSIGLAVMLAEMVIGRAGQRDQVGAYKRLKGGAWPLVGYLGIVTGFLLLSFFSVVAGWTIAYAVKAISGDLTGSSPEALGGLFENFVAQPWQPIAYQGLFMAATVAIVVGGIHKGIERWCKLLMPALFVILLVLVVRSLTLPGAADGIAFFLYPDFSEITGETFNAALAQAFFSLSLGMGVIITYGSYLGRKESLPGAALWVTSLDALVAVLAGFLIMPAVFSFGFDVASGPGLSFITLPAVFAAMPFGQVFAVLFFVLLAIAALTSSVSVLEIVVAYFVDEHKIPRARAASIYGFIIFVIGVPSSLSLGIWGDITIDDKIIFDFVDYLVTHLMLPIGGFFIAIFVGWVIYPKAVAEVTDQGERPFPLMPFWGFTCRYLAPIAIFWILVSGL